MEVPAAAVSADAEKAHIVYGVICSTTATALEPGADFRTGPDRTGRRRKKQNRGRTAKPETRIGNGRDTFKVTNVVYVWDFCKGLGVGTGRQ